MFEVGPGVLLVFWIMLKDVWCLCAHVGRVCELFELTVMFASSLMRLQVFDGVGKCCKYVGEAVSTF